jgi:hypothetical protein
MAVRRLFRAIGKFRRLSRRDRRLFAEALVLLALATAAIRFLPFRTVGRLASRPLRNPVADPASEAELIRAVRRAVLGCARRVPWSAVCFPQGLAAQWMLRRRGIPATLYFGAENHRTKGLNAHVWVRVGAQGVVGTENAAGFAPLAEFPPAPDAGSQAH